MIPAGAGNGKYRLALKPICRIAVPTPVFDGKRVCDLFTSWFCGLKNGE
jgi:hypothetical protein